MTYFLQLLRFLDNRYISWKEGRGDMVLWGKYIPLKWGMNVNEDRLDRFYPLKVKVKVL